MKLGRLSLVLLLACVGLAAWVFQQWVAYQAAAPAPVQQAAAGTPAGGGVRAPDPPPMAPLASYSEIVERPLFVKTRRPPPEPEAQQQVVKKAPGNFKLEGTALSPDGQVAVLRNTRTSELHRLRMGQSVDQPGRPEIAVRAGTADRNLCTMIFGESRQPFYRFSRPAWGSTPVCDSRRWWRSLVKHNNAQPSFSTCCSQLVVRCVWRVCPSP